MQTITTADISARAFPHRMLMHLQPGWQGTVSDILQLEACPAGDRLAAALQESLIGTDNMNSMAIFCAREALKLVPKPDKRSIDVLTIYEQFAHKEVTRNECRYAFIDAVSASSEATAANVHANASAAVCAEYRAAAEFASAARLAAAAAVYAADAIGATIHPKDVYYVATLAANVAVSMALGTDATADDDAVREAVHLAQILKLQELLEAQEQ